MFNRHSNRRSPRGYFVEERRHNWILPLIALVLALIVHFQDAQAEQTWGVTKSNIAYVCVENPPCKPACSKPLVLQFCLYLTEERR